MITNTDARERIMSAINGAKRLGSRDHGKIRHDRDRYSVFVSCDASAPGYGCELQAKGDRVDFYGPTPAGSTLLHEENNPSLAAWVRATSDDIGAA